MDDVHTSDTINTPDLLESVESLTFDSDSVSNLKDSKSFEKMMDDIEREYGESFCYQSADEERLIHEIDKEFNALTSSRTAAQNTTDKNSQTLTFTDDELRDLELQILQDYG